MRPISVSRSGQLKRLGSGMVALSLAALFLLATVPYLNSLVLRTSVLTLFAGGLAVTLAHYGLRLFQYLRIKDKDAYCPTCGWFGKGGEVFRFESCPQCEQEDSVRLLR